jgi:penicillin-binding protein 2B
MDAFGFFKEVGTPFVNETAGTKNMGLPMDYMSSGFGQGSSVTVLQLCQAYSALFNDGNMMMPYVVDSIIDSETGEVLKKYEPTVAGTPISKDTAEKMKPLLRHVLDPYMSGDRFAIEGVDILAKTGTGELYNEETGTYDMVNFTSSIMAAAPGDDPKVMVYWGMVSSNYVAYSSYPFQQILLAALETVGSSGADSQTETPAEIEDGWESYTMPSLVNHSVNYANQQMEGWKTTNIIIGDGTSIVDQYPLAATTVNSNDRVFLLTDGATIVMPDMIGMTRKDLTAFWRMTGISVEISGYGVVVEQNIEPGEVIDSGTQISVVMN